MSARARKTADPGSAPEKQREAAAQRQRRKAAEARAKELEAEIEEAGDEQIEGFSLAGKPGFSTDDALMMMGALTPDDPDENRRNALMLTMVDLEHFEPWSSELYGAIVKNSRRRAGYIKAQEFGEAVFRHTRVSISRDVMYKIEQGRQDPTITQFMAINLTLYGAPIPSKIAMPCICPEWVDMTTQGGRIPESWKLANTAAIEEQTGQTYATPEEAAEAARDDPRLFAIPKERLGSPHPAD